MQSSFNCRNIIAPFLRLIQKLTTKLTKKHEGFFFSVLPSIKLPVIPANAGIQKIRMQVQKLTFWIATSLTLLAMTSGVAGAAINIPFTINLSENVTVTGTPRIAVDVGGNQRFANYTSGTGTNALVFTLSPTIGDVDLDGVTLSPSIELNGGTIKDAAGNDATLTFTPPNTSGIKVNYPSLSMDFTNGTAGRYTLNGTAYNSLSSFLTALGGTFSRNSIATYYDSTGTLQTASANTPRFDYDPVTHAAKGILIEESRRNIAKYSEQLDNTSTWLYGAGSITVTPNTSETTAPDGTNNAEKISIHSTAPVTFTQWNMAVTGTSATYSIYVKQGSSATTGNKFCLRNQTTATNLICGNLNYTTDVFTYDIGTSGVSVQNIGNGWKRLIMTATSGITSGDSLVAYVGFTGNSYSIGEYLYAWGAQVETGSVATSYIPTTTAAMTRAADVITAPVGAWYNQPEGTLSSEFRNEYNRPTSGFAGAGVELYAAGQKHMFALNSRHNGGAYPDGSLIIFGGAAGTTLFQARTTGALNQIIDPSRYYKFAGAMASGNSAFTYDGLNPSLLATTFTLPVPTTFGIGTNFFYYNSVVGHIKNIRYYPVRAQNTQLQLLTQ